MPFFTNFDSNKGTKSKNRFYDLVRKESSSTDGDGKENAESSALKNEASRLLGIVAKKETTKEGIEKLFEFKKKNPHFDILSVSEKLQGEFFSKYVQRQLDWMQKKENGKNIYLQILSSES